MYSQNKYLLAVSGGVDSCVLFDILKKKNYEFIVIHFNHFTRGIENETEQKHVEMLCERNNVACFVYNYKHKEGNFQASAREFRINKYKELIKKYHLKGVILAHHLDDNYENIHVFKDKYFNLMPKIADNNNLKIYRPLINNTKKEIYQYAKTNNITYYEDSSNKTSKYIRNYHRINSENIDDLVKKQKVKAAFETQRRYKKIRPQKTITKDEYLNCRDKKILLYMFIKNYNSEINIKTKLLDDIVKMIDFKGNKKINIGKKQVIYQQYEQIFIKEDTEIISEKRKKIKIGSNLFNDMYFENKIENAYVRAMNPGDKIKLKIGSKKISRYMIDQKIPSEIRKLYPIVVDEKDVVLYIPKITKK